MADYEAPPAYDEKQKENSKSYSLKFDNYDETDADPNALAHLQASLRNVDPEQKQQQPKALPKQGTNYESMYNNKTDTTNTGADNGEQKFAHHIEMNTIKTADVPTDNAPANANVAAMPNMQQILGELKLSLRGQYLELDVGGEIVNCKINNITETKKSEPSPNTGKRTSGLSSVQAGNTVNALTTREKRKQKVELLVKDSTNRWLYHNDIDPDGEENCCDACNRCSNGCVNKFIAIAVIIIQIAAYCVITGFLIDGIMSEEKKRAETCYGPYCDSSTRPCMELTTGALISVMLIGFLWADVINALGTCKYNVFASTFCLLELVVAIVCGFLTAIYTPNSFDAISGAIGILFVHDLDERVYASMQIISRRKKTALCKKLLAVILWICLSLVISMAMACTYNSGSIIPDRSCKISEYQCTQGTTACIWKGFVCNGIRDCDDGSDEGYEAGCDYQGFLETAVRGVDYPNDTIMCLSTGTFLKNLTRCDGKLDCEDGSDEGRVSNCSEFVASKKCGVGLTVTTLTDGWHQQWSGQFKCANGQCIDAQYACDGTPNDCIDGSDEYPLFDQSRNSPLFLSRCPYSQLRDCTGSEALCKVDGKCINKNKLCDGTADCDDAQDEEGCEYECLTQYIVGETRFQCGGAIADINDTYIIFFEPTADVSQLQQGGQNISTLPMITELMYDDSAHLSYLVGLFTAKDTGECVPYEWRCDGLRDCKDGSDEELCTILTCDATTQYQCATSGICIPQDSLCDYIADCGDESDEILKNCENFGRSFPADNDTSHSICEDFGYCTGTLCSDYEVCAGESGYCFYTWYKCDGVCDCPECGDESGCTNTGMSPSPSNQFIQTTGSGVSTDLGSIYCGDELQGYIDSGTKNYHTFTLGQGYANVKFTTCIGLTMELDSLDTVLDLYDSNNIQIATNDDTPDSCTNTVASSIDFNSQYTEWGEGNSYKIEIRGFSGDSTGLYSLQVTCSI